MSMENLSTVEGLELSMLMPTRVMMIVTEGVTETETHEEDGFPMEDTGGQIIA